MNLDEARRQIQGSLVTVDDAFGRTVFDEWMVVALSGLERYVLHYSGPRYEHSPEDFPNDLRPLASELVSHDGRVGNVDFAQDGVGQKFDVLITIGIGLYIILNDTHGSCEELERQPNWAAVRDELVDLGQRFLHEPMTL
jgi:hypothetical protein